MSNLIEDSKAIDPQINFTSEEDEESKSQSLPFDNVSGRIRSSLKTHQQICHIKSQIVKKQYMELNNLQHLH